MSKPSLLLFPSGNTLTRSCCLPRTVDMNKAGFFPPLNHISASPFQAPRARRVAEPRARLVSAFCTARTLPRHGECCINFINFINSSVAVGSVPLVTCKGAKRACQEEF